MELQSLVDATRRLSTKLILSSSDDDPAGIIAGLDAGADDYLMKPVSPRILVARVGSLLASRSRRKKR
jgi:DNA-binding response OmpR family regulator